MYPKNLQIPFKDLPPSIINTSPSNLLLETLLLCCKKKLSSKDLAEQYMPVSFVLHTQSLHDTKQHKPATECMIFIACAVLPPQNAFLDHILIYANIFSWLLRAAWHRNTQCHSNDNCCCTTIPTESQLNFNFFYWAKPGGTNYLCFNTVQFYLRRHLSSKQKHFRSCLQPSWLYLCLISLTLSEYSIKGRLH